MSRELQFTEIERGLDYIKFTVEVMEKDMTRELTDAEIGAVRDSFGDEPVMLYAFARAVIKADRALRVPMTEQEVAAAFSYAGLNGNFVTGIRAAERHHGIGEKA